MTTTRTRYAPLTNCEIDELTAILRNEQVFAFIGGVPTREDFTVGLRRALAGPPKERNSERWINYGVRLKNNGELIGRIEATIHDGLAEVAYLYSPAVWGRGYATEGLLWLHNHLGTYGSVATLWATTHPKNTRSRALLRKTGYIQVASQGLPALYSYDEGDLVFRCNVF